MSSPSMNPAPRGFNFKRNLSLLNGTSSLGFEIASPLKPDVLAALASDTATFPPRDIEFGEIGLQAGTSKPIEFARGTDKISFTASGSAFAGFGVYQSGAALLRKLGENADDIELEALEFGNTDQSVLSVLRWGYAAEGRANGAMALGPVGSATLSVSGNREGFFAIVRRLPADTPARTIVQETADSWMLPRQISSIEQIQPGTWIIAEALGGIGMRLGAQLGYDFNWVKEAELGGLTGDIGLRLEMGINAAVGFSSSSRCAVIVSRESEQKALRLRFFRLKTRQLDVSLDARLNVQAVDTLLPDKIDDFIAAVFDTHGQQILSGIRVLEQWTDPSTKLQDLLANSGIKGAENLIAHLAGVPPERLQQEFDAVQKKAVTFIAKWHELPHALSSTLLKLVEEKVDLTDVRAVANQLSTINPENLRSLLQTQLARIDFFHTPVGRLFEAATDKGVLTLLEKPLSEVQAVGKKVSAILDGSVMEETLNRFQSYVQSELHLDKIFQVVTETDFARMDALLKRKLANFLGQQEFVFQDLEKARKAVRLLLDRRAEYYEKALDALHRKYSFALSAMYQSSTTDQALLDATFDFSDDPTAISTFFHQAVQGKLDDLMVNQPRSVRIAAGMLSHGIKRQMRIDVSLPFMDSSHSHINEALASIEVAPNGGGLLFKLNASDTVASNQRKSVLSLTAGLTKANPKSTAVHLHQDSLEMNYTLLFAKRDMGLKHIRAHIEPAARTFFKKRIGNFAEFIELLDRQAEEAIPNGPNKLGNGLISLEVSLAGSTAKAVGEAWLALPANRKAAAYIDMSNAIQLSLKNHIHDAVFSTPEGYTDAIRTAHTILAYCAIIPRSPEVTGRSGLPIWDFQDVAERKAMLAKPQTVKRMKDLLTRAQETLRDESDAQFFVPRDAAAILGGVNAADPLLHSLLFAEAEVVKHAFQGGLKIAASRNATPADAVKALATFGAKLTEAFNADITTLLGPGIQSIGTQVFLDASRSLMPAGTKMAESNAMMSIEFLKPDSRFDAAALLSAGRVDPRELAFADRVVELEL